MDQYEKLLTAVNNQSPLKPDQRKVTLNEYANDSKQIETR